MALCDEHYLDKNIFSFRWNRNDIVQEKVLDSHFETACTGKAREEAYKTTAYTSRDRLWNRLEGNLIHFNWIRKAVRVLSYIIICKWPLFLWNLSSVIFRLNLSMQNDRISNEVHFRKKFTYLIPPKSLAWSGENVGFFGKCNNFSVSQKADFTKVY